MAQPHTTDAPSHHAQATKETIKDTLISVIIAFVLAFVFRGFVIEAFVIPTGSMAPTLMGQHMVFRGEQSGYWWQVGPWYARMGESTDYKDPQGAPPEDPIDVHDPMTGGGKPQASVPLKAGDRILVLKYLYALFEPKRFDIVVFKFPGSPGVNYIKRLIGLAGEQTALVDGDVFYRVPTGGPEDAPTLELWKRKDWKIARKSVDAAKAVWQPVFDSDFTPIDPLLGGVKPWFNGPWKADGPASSNWKIENSRSYTYSGTAPTTLKWDADQIFVPRQSPMLGAGPLKWEITDRYAYNETPQVRNAFFPVSDLRMRAAVEVPATGTPPTVSAIIQARGHEFRGTLDGSSGKATLEMRSLAQTGSEQPWKTIGSGTFAGLKPGTVTNIEFWHVDQWLSLWVDGKRVTDKGEYGDDPADPWTPAKRFEMATGRTIEDVMQNPGRASAGAELTVPELYRKPQVRWTFSGGPLVLHRVALDRDLFYQPCNRNNAPGWATHPSTTMTLTREQFFVCGDNSPASLDGRLWSASPDRNSPRGNPDPWVAAKIDPTVGVVPRELLLGKAFFVYFPALAGNKPIPMPDFGRMRFVR